MKEVRRKNEQRVCPNCKQTFHLVRVIYDANVCTDKDEYICCPYCDYKELAEIAKNEMFLTLKE